MEGTCNPSSHVLLQHRQLPEPGSHSHHIVCWHLWSPAIQIRTHNKSNMAYACSCNSVKGTLTHTTHGTGIKSTEMNNIKHGCHKYFYRYHIKEYVPHKLTNQIDTKLSTAKNCTQQHPHNLFVPSYIPVSSCT